MVQVAAEGGRLGQLSAEIHAAYENEMWSENLLQNRPKTEKLAKSKVIISLFASLGNYWCEYHCRINWQI